MLVWFERPDDPTSIQLADPARLPQLNDSEIKLRKVTVEITRDELRRSVAQALPWLIPVGKQRPTLMPRPRVLPGQGIKKRKWSPVEKVGPGSFSTELFRN
jgi:hypothetical protein